MAAPLSPLAGIVVPVGCPASIDCFAPAAGLFAGCRRLGATRLACSRRLPLYWLLASALVRLKVFDLLKLVAF
eukprot:1396053-Pleurochrysis_carterae.AAC.1